MAEDPEEQELLTSGEAVQGLERLRSIERPLTVAAGPLSDDASTHNLPPSSLDSAKICRYCLENSDEVDPFNAGHLIAPCQCRGTSKWVHRGCLDSWRAAQSDRAFSTCTECHFAYEFVAPEAEEKQPEGCQRKKLRLKFQLLVGRDVTKFFLVFQLAILVLGGFIRSIDCDLGPDIGWWDCANVTEADLLEYVETAAYQDEQENTAADLSECCPAGDIINSFPFVLLKNHSRFVYYVVGLLAFCLIYGLIQGGGLCGDGSADDCCFGACRRFRSRGQCQAGVGSFAAVLHCCFMTGHFVIALVLLFSSLALIFTFAGAMAAGMAMSVVVQQAIQRHMHVVHKLSMATRFVVEDLCGEGDCRSLAEALAERGGTEPPTMARTSVRNRVVLTRHEVQQMLRGSGVEVE